MKLALLGDIALFGKYSLYNSHVLEYFNEISKFLRANFKMLSEAYEYAQICAYPFILEGLVANRKIFLSNFLQ